jgi:hypothetical protein
MLWVDLGRGQVRGADRRVRTALNEEEIVRHHGGGLSG